ncbi:MAG: hypothetical protein ACK5BL_08135 [Flavobacteriales bacterium]|jgi:hypothetical protein
MMKNALFTLLLLIPFGLCAQFSIGTWRDHFPYKRCIDVCEANNFIFAATANSVFSFDQFTGEINRFNKTNRLSDVGISALAFDPLSQFVIVGYSNGNVDLFNEREVFNIPFIKFSTLIGDKTIYDIYPYGDRIFLSTGFGIVVIDVPGREIKETYFIGTSGEAVRVRDIAIHNEVIYAVTEQGLRTADVNNTFLSNFENWTTAGNLPGTEVPTHIEFFNNEIVLAIPGAASDTVWSKPVDGSTWVDRFPLENFRINQLWSNGEWFSVSGSYAYWYSRNNLDSRIVISMVAGNLLHTYNAIIGYNGYAWAADKFNGLMLSKDPFGFEDILVSPQGPNSDDCRRITAYNNNVWIAHGGVGPSWGQNNNSDGISAYIDDRWISFSADTMQSAGQHFNNSNQYVMDFMDFAVDPIDNNNVYAASWEEGLLKIDIPNRRIIPVNGTATTGPDSDGINDDYVRTAVAGVTYSKDGVLWCTNGYTKRALHALDRDGNFYDYNFSTVIGDDEKIADILISNDGYIWANVINEGLLVLNNNATLDVFSDDNFKLLTDDEGNGKLPSNDVLCMEEDLDGEVWVGTASGLSIFYNPASIFEEGNFDSEQILIQQEGNTQILLETEAINCIEIDGSNRKWIGTKSSGAYLLSDDGLREVYHFTEENSPLPSNTVYDIGINHSNGEVFFATENGVVGFFSTATNFDNEMSNVRVFPNPVRPDYDGNITIDGLAYNTSVKITDIQGNILFETESEGGRAVWNGMLSDGSRPATGVYLVYVSTPLGTADEVRKLTFIR